MTLRYKGRTHVVAYAGKSAAGLRAKLLWPDGRSFWVNTDEETIDAFNAERKAVKPSPEIASIKNNFTHVEKRATKEP